MAKKHQLLEEKRAAIYVRVSTQMQIDKASLPVQREELINYAKYAFGINSYEVFEDAGYSAKNTDRPDYQKMMARIRTGEFSHLMVWKIDRISRNLLDFAAMYAELKELGVTFVSKTEQFDTSSAMGEAMLKIILVFAELERNMTSERVTAVMMSRAQSGSWNGGRTPYGYAHDAEEDVFTIVEEEARIVRLIYDSYEAKRSLVTLSKDLNAMGLTTRAGKAWNPASLRTILRNPFYVGTLRYNYYAITRSPNRYIKPEDEWVLVENHHPAIISKEQQNRVIAILAKQQRSLWGGGKTYQRKNIHIFAGLLKCGICGSTMSASIDTRERKSGVNPSFYCCSRRRRFNDCDNKYITDLTIGPFILNFIANLIKASKSFGKSTSIETFQKKLLRGEAMKEVDHIGEAGLTELYNHLRRGFEPATFSAPRVAEVEAKSELSERDILLTEKRRLERALNRLKSIYLYSDEAMSEKDYLTERKELLDKLEATDNRIEEIDAQEALQTNISDDEFMAKASYFILSQQLQDKRHIDFEKFISHADPAIIKDFLKNVTTNFCIKNGHVISILFKNGIELQFFYKAWTDDKSPETA